MTPRDVTPEPATVLDRLEKATARLRHAYSQLANGTLSKRGARPFADGLIAPSIRELEELANDLRAVPPTTPPADKDGHVWISSTREPGFYECATCWMFLRDIPSLHKRTCARMEREDDHVVAVQCGAFVYNPTTDCTCNAPRCAGEGRIGNDGRSSQRTRSGGEPRTRSDDSAVDQPAVVGPPATPPAGRESPHKYRPDHWPGAPCLVCRLEPNNHLHRIWTERHGGPPAAEQEPPQMSNLPKRDRLALVEALRIRALALTGQEWELSATRDMMKEAAQILEDLASEPSSAALEALKRAHSVLNKHQIDWLSHGGVEQTEEFKTWMRERREVLTLIELALRASSPSGAPK